MMTTVLKGISKCST